MHYFWRVIQLIGQKIHSVRTEKNITLEDIASKVGVAKSTIQRYEAGKIQNPKLPVIESIANALNVNPAWLVGKSDDKEIVQKSLPKIFEYYNSLNDIGKHEATKRVQELTFIPQYQNNASSAIAAHNEHIDADELEKIKIDIANLKRPD